MPAALHLRYQGKAVALSRMVATRMRDLKRLQDAALKAAAAAAAGPLAPQAPVAASGVRAAAAATRPEVAATGTDASLGDDVRDQLLKQITARLAAAGTAIAA